MSNLALILLNTAGILLTRNSTISEQDYSRLDAPLAKGNRLLLFLFNINDTVSRIAQLIGLNRPFSH